MALRRKTRVSPAQRARQHGFLAAVVVARRQELNLTQTELAELAGVSVRFVHAAETGHTEVGLDRLLTLLGTLGLHLEINRGTTPGLVASPALQDHYDLDAAPRGAK